MRFSRPAKDCLQGRAVESLGQDHHAEQDIDPPGGKFLDLPFPVALARNHLRPDSPIRQPSVARPARGQTVKEDE